MVTNLVSIRESSLSFENLYDETVLVRENLIMTIDDLSADGHKLIVIEGSPGVGKTTLLLQFAKMRHSNSFAFFINPACKITYTQDYFLEDLGRQLHFHVFGSKAPNDMEFNEKQFNSLVLNLMKKHVKKGERLYFVIDGLDQIEKADQNLLLPVLNSLPFNANNFYFVVSGEINNLLEILPPQMKKKSKSLRITPFSVDEIMQFFGWFNENERKYAKELHSNWRGHPDVMSQIKRILNYGTTIDDFLNTDFSQKNDLLQEEWRHSELDRLSLDDASFKAICILSFTDTTRRVDHIETILGLEPESLKGLLSPFPFITIRGNEVDFASNSFRAFAQQKMAKHKNSILSLLVEYYNNKDDKNSLQNLPQLLHEKKDYGSIVKLLNPSNLTILLNNSQSFGEINRHLNLGYGASNKLNKAFEELFRFSLHRSTLLGIQISERRENQLEAYVRLGKIQEAERLITNAVLREDKLRSTVRFLKEVKENTNEVIEDRYIEEVRDLLKQCDKAYIKQNLIELVLDLAYINPALAISTVEDVAGQKTGNSLEWVLGYIAFLSKRGLDNNPDGLKSILKSDDELESFVDKFSESIGFSVKDISGYDVIEEVEKARTVTDKIFRIKGWIKEHPTDGNIFKVIEYGLDLLIENASQIKPTATTLFEIIHAMTNIKEERHLKILVSKIKNLLLTANAPTIDKYRVEFAVVLAIFQYNESESENLAFNIAQEMDEIEDCGVKLEVQVYCYDLIMKICDSLPFDAKFIFTVDEIRDYIENTFKTFLRNTAEQYDELKSALIFLSTVDLPFALSLATRLNTQYRRFMAVRRSVTAHCANLTITKWNVTEIDFAFKALKSDSIMYASTMMRLVAAVMERLPELTNDDRLVFAKLVKLIENITNNSVRCKLLTQSIVILSGNSANPDEFSISFKRQVLDKLKPALRTSWNSLPETMGKLTAGYSIASHLAKTDQALADEYLNSAEVIANSVTIDNYYHLTAFVESIKLCIRLYAGIIANEKSFGYSKIESSISMVPSIREQILLWSDLAVKCYTAGDIGKSNEIVQIHIVPSIEKYRAGSDSEYFYFLVRTAASALQFTQPDTLHHFFQTLTNVQRDEIIHGVTYTLLSKKFDTEPYSGNTTTSKVTYNEISNFIHLLQFATGDYIIFSTIQRLTSYLRENPSEITREQKISVGEKLKTLYQSKLPNRAIGIHHDGYLILCKAVCSHYTYNISIADFTKLFDDFQAEALKIENLPDRSFTLCWLALECLHTNSGARKKQIDLINKAFEETKKIECLSERMTSYLELSERASRISSEFFRERQTEILEDLYKLDEKDMFPTSRKFIDLAYKCDKHLAQKWVDTLDSDPARENLAEPTKDRNDQLIMEAEVRNDYSFFGRIKDRERAGDIAWKMLGELHSGKRSSRTLDKTVFFLYSSSAMPIFDSVPAFAFFIENFIADDSTDQSMLRAFYNAACGNSDFCYSLISNMNNKKVSMGYNLSDHHDSMMVQPGMRQEAVQFIKKHVKNVQPKELIIIDQYFSEKDARFIKDLTSWVFGMKLTVLTSNKGARNLNRETFQKAWQDISTDAIPEITIIKTWTGGEKSPFHDRWIVFNDKLQALWLGTSINSLGNQISAIKFVHQEEENKQIQNTLVLPFVKNRVDVFDSQQVKYESFDMWIE